MICLFAFTGRIHHLNWFEDGTLLAGYIWQESSDNAQVHQSSLALIRVDLSGSNSCTLEVIDDLDDPVCDRQPTDEADELSKDQQYFTRYIKEWLEILTYYHIHYNIIFHVMTIIVFFKTILAR